MELNLLIVYTSDKEEKKKVKEMLKYVGIDASNIEEPMIIQSWNKEDLLLLLSRYYDDEEFEMFNHERLLNDFKHYWYGQYEGDSMDECADMFVDYIKKEEYLQGRNSKKERSEY